MSNFSILLLKDSDVGVSQYHFGKKLLFFLLMLLMLGAAALAWKFFEQHQTIANQNSYLKSRRRVRLPINNGLISMMGVNHGLPFLKIM